MGKTVRETIKEIIRNHLKKKKGKYLVSHLTAVGWVGGTCQNCMKKMV